MSIETATHEFANPDMHRVIGTHDIVFITLDTLRFDVADSEFRAGRLPILQRHLPPSGWALRHTPGTFTYAAHCAFFAGFLPTPARPGTHPRLWALEFEGSETTDAHTFVFAGVDNIVAGLAHQGYRTLCLGGVGFFNLRNPLGSVLPRLFVEHYWEPAFGVAAAQSTQAQVALACARLSDASLADVRVFLFLNVSAIHQPNGHYAGLTTDSLASHGAALRYVDQALAPLWLRLARRGPSFVILCSDHGTAYGEDGFTGHRHAHPVVMQVPYAHFEIAPHA